MPFSVPQYGAQPPEVPQGVRQNLQPQAQQQPQQQPRQRQQEYSGMGRGYQQAPARSYGQPQQQPRRQPQYSSYGGYGRGQQQMVPAQARPQYDAQPRRQSQQQWDQAQAPRPDMYLGGDSPQPQQQMDVTPVPQQKYPGVDQMQASKYPLNQYRAPQQQWGMPPMVEAPRYNPGPDVMTGEYDVYNKRGY